MTAPDEFDPYLAWLDIEPAEHPVDHYKLLGLERFEADEEVIRRAADSRMGHVRSFQTGPRGRHTQKLLNELAAAKLCLLNPGTKTTYDAVLQGTEAAGHSAAPLPPPVQEYEDPKSSYSPPQPTSAAGVTGPTPPPVEDSDTTEPSAQPILKVQRPQIRRRRPKRQLAVIGIILLLAVAGGAIFAIVGLRQASTDSQPAGASHSGNDDKAVADQPALPSEDVETTDNTGDATVIEQEANGSFQFPATLAKLEGDGLQRVKEGTGAVITGWSNQEDSISWEFRATKTGFFKALVVYEAEEASAGGSYLIEIGKKESKAATVRVGASPGAEVTDELFVIVSRKGLNRIRLRAVEIHGEQLMKFRSLTLVPRGS